MALNDGEIAVVKGMLIRGDKQHAIAAGPYTAGRSALRARDTLTALRDLIQEAIEEIDLYEKSKD
jgi:hypothetical protein